MNERIREIANELGPIATIGNWGRVEWKDNVYPQLGDKLYAAIDLQKFALLIVRECVNRVRSRQQFATEDNQNVTQAFDLLVYDIESHFGVE